MLKTRRVPNKTRGNNKKRNIQLKREKMAAAEQPNFNQLFDRKKRTSNQCPRGNGLESCRTNPTGKWVGGGHCGSH